jgi:hypothetical protein
MQITVIQTGGFAGVHQQVGPVDSSSLDPEVAEQVDRIIAESDFFNLPERLPTTGQVYDDFNYAVHVVDGDHAHTVELEGQSDHPAAPAILELISLLDGAAGGFRPILTNTGLPDGVVETRDWSAWYNRMPGSDDRDLHVSGICGVASSHTTVRLEPGDAGVVPEEDLCVLQLVVARPDIDDDRYVELPVSWQGDVGPDKKRVRIHGVSLEIPVKTAE